MRMLHGAAVLLLLAVLATIWCYLAFVNASRDMESASGQLTACSDLAEKIQILSRKSTNRSVVDGSFGPDNMVDLLVNAGGMVDPQGDDGSSPIERELEGTSYKVNNGSIPPYRMTLAQLVDFLERVADLEHSVWITELLLVSPPKDADQLAIDWASEDGEVWLLQNLQFTYVTGASD